MVDAEAVRGITLRDQLRLPAGGARREPVPLYPKSRFVPVEWVGRANATIKRGHVADEVERAFLKHSQCYGDITFYMSTLDMVPRRYHMPILRRFEQERKKSLNAGNLMLSGVRNVFERHGVDISADDEELIRQAKDYAADIRGLLVDQMAEDAGAFRERLNTYVSRRGIRPPECETLRGLVARLTDHAWWVRQLRRTAGRAAEGVAINLGMVHKRASIYASAEACERRRQQRRRNRKMLENTQAMNEEGQVFTLAELSDLNTSNPKLRRAELMTRIAGFEAFADQRGDVGLFITATAPSRMHARHYLSGQQNEKWDGTTPRQAQAYLSGVWSRVRSWLHRRSMFVYGFRIAEPHHDGTPHWHMLLFVARAALAKVVAALQGYFCKADAGELESTTAREARFKAIEIDRERGSAAGYVAKYVAKNIDGEHVGADFETEMADAADTVKSVDAWASTHGIRQFQQIGGPSVTVWRELRRAEVPEQLELFAPFKAAAENERPAQGWADYVDLMGGIECRRAARPLRPWKEDEGGENRYGEPAGAVLVGIEHLNFERLLSRVHRWEVRPGLDKSVRGSDRTARSQCRHVVPGAAGVPDIRLWKMSDTGAPEKLQRYHQAAEEECRRFGFESPWTRVNNCTVQGGADIGNAGGLIAGAAGERAGPW